MDDPWEEAAALEAAVRETRGAVLYPGGHLFADSGSSDYDEAATTLLLERTLAFLPELGDHAALP